LFFGWFCALKPIILLGLPHFHHVKIIIVFYFFLEGSVFAGGEEFIIDEVI